MKPAAISVIVLIMGLTAHATTASGQSVAPSLSVPRLVNLSGTFRPADGQPPAPIETIRLALYADEVGWTALWEERQTLQIDTNGQYSVLLGQTQPDGVPLDVFVSGEARWLGLLWERPGEGEGPRVRVTSAPYALRAADADTLGGRPASAYQLAPAATEAGSNATASATRTTQSTITPASVLGGTPNFLAKATPTS